MVHVETDQEWRDATAAANRESWRYAALSLPGVAVFTVIARAAGDALATGPARYVVGALVAAVLGVPLAVAVARDNFTKRRRADELALRLRAELEAVAATAHEEAVRQGALVRRQDYETRVANALEMADGEPEVIGAVERAFLATLPDVPVELLLADNSHAHLTRVAVSAPHGEAPGCGVDSPNRCPVARRAQVQRFEDSDALDACPKLRGRPQGRCSAVCVPVSIMGRTVGVIHALGQPDQQFDDATVQDLSTLANLAGARIGLLRVMSETQLQAATDALTGLMNRRSLENEVATLRASATKMVALMADLDHFKQLNDTYGHETGDRALRAFAQSLRAAVRGDDLVARYGGEEFAVVMPDLPLTLACEAVEAVRASVAEGLRGAGLPEVTASFGLVEASDGEELYELLARADAALLDAKREGRDRVVVHDRYGRVVDVSARGPRLVAP